MASDPITCPKCRSSASVLPLGKRYAVYPAGCFMILGLLIASSPATAQSSKARKFFEENLVIDGTCFPYYRPGTSFHRFPRLEDGTFDMSDYTRGTGVDLAVWDIRHPQEMMKMIRGVKLGHFINTRVIQTVDDIELMFESGEHGWLFYTQNPWPLNGGVDPVQVWHRNGLRMVQIVYGTRIPVPELDKLGTGSSREDDESSGLTELGKRFVRECQRVGIIVDVSHCNRQTTLDACAISEVPLVCTHAGCEAITRAKRNKSDEEIKAIAATGGVVGITPIKFMLSESAQGATMDDFIAHLEHVISIVGIDHVGVSSDIKRNGVEKEEVVAYTCEKLNGEERWFHLHEALVSKGYEDDDLKKIFGLNFLRVFEAGLK
ncbi:MAG: membrane dipeptidase [Verrucomicrobiales bacterium]|nr:membrane dipeptidase [Verrucomicrobiales bacterium]